MSNLFDSPTRRLSLSDATAPEVTATVAEEDIVGSEDLEVDELEVTRQSLRQDAETRRASPELVGRYLRRTGPDPADELELDRGLELPAPESPALAVDSLTASAPTLDDLLDDALRTCAARQLDEAMRRAVEPPPVVDPPQAIRPRVERRARLLWRALAVVGGTALGVAIAFALLRLLA
jgi:hypothetical protein